MGRLGEVGLNFRNVACATSCRGDLMSSVFDSNTRRRRTGFAARRTVGLQLALVAGLAFVSASRTVRAGVPTTTILDNGTVTIGINDTASLNVDGPPSSGGSKVVGLRFNAGNFESLSPGCDCEGWGVGDLITQQSGWANQTEGGPNNLTIKNFVVSGGHAISTTEVPGLFEVTHDFAPAGVTPNLFTCQVTIKNISTAATDVIYRRNLDWDVEPTPFEEFVTILRGNASGVIFTSDDGFASSNPLEKAGAIRKEALNQDVVDSGPDDHGALFDFAFGKLASGNTVTFKIFFGAAATEANALSALEAVGAEAYSLGQPSGKASNPALGTPVTFIFGFAGIGGTPIFGELSGIQVQDISPSAALITWNTNQAATSVIDFGTGAKLNRKFEDRRLVTRHEIVLRGFPQRSQIRFRVSSVFSFSGKGGATKTVSGPERLLITGRNVDGLTPGIAPVITSGSAQLQGSLLNNCHLAATDVIVTNAYVQQAGTKKQFFPTNVKFPSKVGTMTGNNGINFLLQFDPQAFAPPIVGTVKGKPQPARFVIEGTKIQGRCVEWRDFIQLPVVL